MRFLVVIACAVGVPVAAGPAQESFRTTADAVRTFAVVQDRNGHVVTGISVEDFEVRDNGRPVPITVFANDPQPIDVAIVLEAGSNVAGRLRTLTTAVHRFLDALTPADRAMLTVVNAEVATSGASTADFTRLRRMLDTELWLQIPHDVAVLWEGLHRTFDVMDRVQDRRGRRAVLVLGSGKDECPNASNSPYPCRPFGPLRGRAIDHDVLVYLLRVKGLRDELTNLGQYSKFKPIEDLTRDSGGLIDPIERDADVPGAVERAIAYLRHQYLLGFTPASPDGREHRLEVRARQPGLTVRARRSYVPGSRP